MFTSLVPDCVTFSKPFPGADDPRFTELDALIAAGVTKPLPNVGAQIERGLVLRGACSPIRDCEVGA